MKKAVFYFLTALATLTIIGEVWVRAKGYSPYRYTPTNIKMEPKMMYVFDSLEGYKMDSGVFAITDAGLTSKATHNSNGYRVTSFTNDTVSATAPQSVMVYGGASTYGYLVPDEKTFPFLLQQKLPACRVRNYAVPGYGVVNTYVQLTKLTPLKKGDVVIYTYFYEHDNRPSHAVQKEIYASVKEGIIPNTHFIAWGQGLNTELQSYNYRLWPLNSYSVLVNYLEDWYNEYRDTHNNTAQKAREALLDMNRFCNEKGATFILFVKQDDETTLATMKYCQERGIKTVNFSDIQIDYPDDPDVSTGEHPNVIANREIAQRLFNYLVSNKLIDSLPADPLP